MVAPLGDLALANCSSVTIASYKSALLKSVPLKSAFSDWYYLIRWKPNYNVSDIYSILACHVDEAFKTALYAHMGNARDFEHFRTLAQQPKKDALLNQPMKETPQSREVNLLSYHNLLERLKNEEKLHFDDLKLLSQATTKRITLDRLSPHFMRLTIDWRTPVWATQTALFWRPCGRASAWTDEEKEILRNPYPTGLQEDLLRLLPLRTWQSIYQKAARIGLQREKRCSLDSSLDRLAIDDIQVMNEYGLTLDELSSDNQIIWLTCSTCFSNTRCCR